jgi:hypothetical protein
MSDATNDRIIHMPPDLDVKAAVSLSSATNVLSDDEWLALATFDVETVRSPERTQAEVVAALRGAAESLMEDADAR